MIDKVCVFVERDEINSRSVLAFEHPEAGRQFVKGTIEPGEPIERAAARELLEESGVVAKEAFRQLGATTSIMEGEVWHFVSTVGQGLPDSWEFQTQDDHGHVFKFFWHELDHELSQEWDHRYHRALAYFLCNN